MLIANTFVLPVIKHITGELKIKPNILMSYCLQWSGSTLHDLEKRLSHVSRLNMVMVVNPYYSKFSLILHDFKNIYSLVLLRLFTVIIHNSPVSYF